MVAQASKNIAAVVRAVCAATAVMVLGGEGLAAVSVCDGTTF
jgi:hypothetical protein